MFLPWFIDFVQRFPERKTDTLGTRSGASPSVQVAPLPEMLTCGLESSVLRTRLTA